MPAFCLNRIVAFQSNGGSFVTQADLAYLDGGGSGGGSLAHRKKEFQGFRLEQTGECEVQFALRASGGRERRVPAARRIAVAGDTTSGPMSGLGVVASEVAPEFRVEHDEPWSLSSIGFELKPLSEWAP